MDQLQDLHGKFVRDSGLLNNAFARVQAGDSGSMLAHYRLELLLWELLWKQAFQEFMPESGQFQGDVAQTWDFIWASLWRDTWDQFGALTSYQAGDQAILELEKQVRPLLQEAAEQSSQEVEEVFASQNILPSSGWKSLSRDSRDVLVQSLFLIFQYHALKFRLSGDGDQAREAAKIVFQDPGSGPESTGDLSGNAERIRSLLDKLAPGDFVLRTQLELLQGKPLPTVEDESPLTL